MIAPRDPDSLAQVGVSPLTGAGNLWLWQPQVRIEQRVGLGNSAGLRAQVSLFQTSFLNNLSDPNSYSPRRTGASQPKTPILAWKAASKLGRAGVKPAASKSPAGFT